MNRTDRAVMLIQCPDKKGIISEISTRIHGMDANIVRADQHTTDEEKAWFFMRIEFEYSKNSLVRDRIENEAEKLAEGLSAEWKIYYENITPRMAVLVSTQEHCLVDLLQRHQSGELKVNIPFVISNHEENGKIAENYGIEFVHIPVSSQTKRQNEKQLLDLVKGTTDFLVLARYMQILSEEFLNAYAMDIINIHHSFLPGFKGSSPYRQAYDRGVKLIGATAHYVTSDLDEGPIIAQMVERVSPKDSLNDMIRKGKNIEKITLANAVHAHTEKKIIRYKNKTIVFD